MALVGGIMLLLPGLVVAVTHDVVIDFATFAFTPQNITIQQGDIIRWTNNTDAIHTTTGGNPSGNPCTASGLWSASLSFNGAQFSRVFNEAPGLIRYFCIPHCGGLMRGNITIQSPPVGIEPPQVPTYTLYQNVPNPFSPTTTIDYEIATTSRVEIEIYNVEGRRIALLENDVRDAGRYPVFWDGKDEQGNPQATGVYFYQMKLDGIAVQMKKMALIR
jgi:plastocyanin